MIVAVFMHMAWERLTLVTVISLPPLIFLSLLILMMVLEGDYTRLTRILYFGSAGG